MPIFWCNLSIKIFSTILFFFFSWLASYLFVTKCVLDSARFLPSAHWFSSFQSKPFQICLCFWQPFLILDLNLYLPFGFFSQLKKFFRILPLSPFFTLVRTDFVTHRSTQERFFLQDAGYRPGRKIQQLCMSLASLTCTNRLCRSSQSLHIDSTYVPTRGVSQTRFL